MREQSIFKMNIDKSWNMILCTMLIGILSNVFVFMLKVLPFWPNGHAMGQNCVKQTESINPAV